MLLNIPLKVEQPAMVAVINTKKTSNRHLQPSRDNVFRELGMGGVLFAAVEGLIRRLVAKVILGGQFGDSTFSGGIDNLAGSFAADVAGGIDTGDGCGHFIIGDDKSAVVSA
jgi:hypothetical protein